MVDTANLKFAVRKDIPVRIREGPLYYFDEAIMKCDHSQIYDEPPQCAKCSTWVCGNCLTVLINPVGLCLNCAVASLHFFRDDFAKRKKHYTIIERLT